MSRITLGAIADSDVAVQRLGAAGMSAEQAVTKRARFASAAEALIRAGHAPDTYAVAVFVPGRIEVFGKHTDYCGGRSLLCTVERGLCFVAVATAGESVRFRALDPNEEAVLHADRKIAAPAGHWSRYPGSVVRRFARNFPGLPMGADIAMTGDLPKASGLSSSSAMIVGTFLALAEISGAGRTESYRRHLPDLESLAGYLGTVENGRSYGPFVGDGGVGTFGGSQDHTAILCCRPGFLSMYSFCPVRHERDVALDADMQFVIADSGVAAEKTGSALAKYNRVSARVGELVSLWNAAGGRAACLNDIVSGGAGALARLRQLIEVDRSQLADDLMGRLDQFLIESNNLIPKAADMVQEGDWQSLRWIAEESQARAVACLLNQVPETNALQHDLVNHGAYAASAFGAGFGGSVWGLFHRDVVSRWRSSESAARHAWFTTRPGCAATVL